MEQQAASLRHLVSSHHSSSSETPSYLILNGSGDGELERFRPFLSRLRQKGGGGGDPETRELAAGQGMLDVSHEGGAYRVEGGQMTGSSSQ